MFSTMKSVVHVWSQEFESTQKVLKHLTDRSLSQAVTPEGRTLGFLAWHLVITIREMMERTGLAVKGPEHNAPVPAHAKEIFDAFNASAESFLHEIQKHWTDDSLDVEDNMYGETWKRGKTVQALIFHMIHHRAQMTVLMRQAGLKVPGMYGPSKEEWAAMGMNAPR